jgi:hypothetical protein
VASFVLGLRSLGDEVRVGIADADQVAGARAGAQLVQQLVGARVFGERRHGPRLLALGHLEGAEDDGLVCWQAVLSSCSRMLRFSMRELMRVRSMRCTQ